MFLTSNVVTILQRQGLEAKYQKHRPAHWLLGTGEASLSSCNQLWAAAWEEIPPKWYSYTPTLGAIVAKDLV